MSSECHCFFRQGDADVVVSYNLPWAKYLNVQVYLSTTRIRACKYVVCVVAVTPSGRRSSSTSIGRVFFPAIATTNLIDRGRDASEKRPNSQAASSVVGQVLRELDWPTPLVFSLVYVE
jgi:hypothetical protein